MDHHLVRIIRYKLLTWKASQIIKILKLKIQKLQDSKMCNFTRKKNFTKKNNKESNITLHTLHLNNQERYKQKWEIFKSSIIEAAIAVLEHEIRHVRNGLIANTRKQKSRKMRLEKV